MVTASLEHISDRIRHLVYLDAFVPENGETVLGHALGMGRPTIEIGMSWTMPPAEREFDKKSEGEWMRLRRTPHPLGCFTEPVFLEKPLENFEFSRTYIKASMNPDSDPGADALWKAANRAKDSSAWEYQEIATTHMVANNEPKALSEILLQVVSCKA